MTAAAAAAAAAAMAQAAAAAAETATVPQPSFPVYGLTSATVTDELAYSPVQSCIGIRDAPLHVAAFMSCFIATPNRCSFGVSAAPEAADAWLLHAILFIQLPCVSGVCHNCMCMMARCRVGATVHACVR